MTKKVVLLVFACLSAGLLWSQTASITELAGKVEYQIPGRDWRPARVGDQLAAGTVISTGFKSSAKLQIANAVLTVNPVTRLTLEELIQTQAGSQSQLFLLSGRVSADVTPEANKTTEFKVSSPTATASVRGTSFQFDGVNLLVASGIVEIRTPFNQFRRAKQGEFTYVATNGQVATPAAVAQGSGFQNVSALIMEVQNSDLSGSLEQTLIFEIYNPITIVPPEQVSGQINIILE